MSTRRGATQPPLRVLIIATVSQSLALQSTASWDVLSESHADITFAAGKDEWSGHLGRWGRYVELPAERRLASFDHVKFLVACRRLIDQQDWDLIQIQTPIAATLARIALGRNDATVVYVAHGFHFHQDAAPWVNATVSRLERLLARRCDAVAVVAREDYESAVAMGMGRHTMLWHLPGAGVDTAAFAAAPPELPFGEPHLLFCGDMINRKNPLMVVDTALELLERGDPHPLVMIGDGPLLEAVHSRAAPLDARGLFAHVPRTDNVAGYMAGAGVHLLPSWQEGVPRVTMEAMASTVPTVAMNNRGSRELASAGAGPVMARDSSAHDWADAVSSTFGHRLDGDVAAALEFYGLESFRQSYRQLLQRVGVLPHSD